MDAHPGYPNGTAAGLSLIPTLSSMIVNTGGPQFNPSVLPEIPPENRMDGSWGASDPNQDNKPHPVNLSFQILFLFHD